MKASISLKSAIRQVILLTHTVKAVQTINSTVNQKLSLKLYEPKRIMQNITYPIMFFYTSA
jgi:hypothetical protein